MKSLKSKLLLTTVSLLLVLSLVNLFVGIITSYRGLSENVKKDLQTTITTATSGIAETLQVVKNDVRVCAKNLQLKDGQIEHTAHGLVQQAENFGWEAIALADADGKTHSEDSGMEDMDLSGNEYFQRALKGEVVISSTFFDNNGDLRMMICAPLSDARGVYIAVLNGMYMRGMIDNITIGETGNVFVLDKEGTMIANVREEMVNSRSNYIEIAKTDKSAASMGAVFANMAAGKTGTEKYKLNGVSRIAAYQPLGNETDGWSVGAAAPTAEMLSSIGGIVIWMIVACLLALAIAVLVSVRLAKSIADPLRKLSDRFSLLAEGDLHSPVPDISSRDEIGVLAQSAAAMKESLNTVESDIERILTAVSGGDLTVSSGADYQGDFQPIHEALSEILRSLNDTMGDINISADQVASGAEQVSSGAQALAQGSTEQASSIQELAATINDVSGHVGKTADNASEARDYSVRNGEAMNESNDQMKQMMGAMSEISSKSGEIGKIIKTIEDIAFQTNILALNAAVEAARAGAAGKGFAVVADEVRNLANKSQEAAKNITGLIKQTVDTVESGTAIAAQTADSMMEVVNGAHRVGEYINSIAKASEQQAEAIGQITQGVDQISSVVQTNSATAEESAAASEELSNQAQLLRKLVSRFRIREQERAALSYVPEKQDDNEYMKDYSNKPEAPVSKFSSKY